MFEFLQKVRFLPILCVLMLTGIQMIYAQEGGQVKGVIVDQQGEAIPNASVVLFDETETDTVTGAASNGLGEFTIDADPGSYVLVISYISYTNFKTDVVIASGEVTGLDSITLTPEQSELEEVLVEGQRSYMQMNFDSRSFNVGSDITSLGGSALDVFFWCRFLFTGGSDFDPFF